MKVGRNVLQSPQQNRIAFGSAECKRTQLQCAQAAYNAAKDDLLLYVTAHGAISNLGTNRCEHFDRTLVHDWAFDHIHAANNVHLKR